MMIVTIRPDQLPAVFDLAAHKYMLLKLIQIVELKSTSALIQTEFALLSALYITR